MKPRDVSEPHAKDPLSSGAGHGLPLIMWFVTEDGTAWSKRHSGAGAVLPSNAVMDLETGLRCASKRSQKAWVSFVGDIEA